MKKLNSLRSFKSKQKNLIFSTQMLLLSERNLMILNPFSGWLIKEFNPFFFFSGTSTTNATQTRVTPRAQQLQVTPLHLPGMGMTQFDPFLPCQSHHIRPSARRRYRGTPRVNKTLSLSKRAILSH